MKELYNMKNNFPTAEEFNNDIRYVTYSLDEKLITFAKLHVEAALKEASKTKKIDLFVRPDIKGSKYKLIEPGESYDLLNTIQMFKVNKDSILNAYPLDLIK